MDKIHMEYLLRSVLRRVDVINAKQDIIIEQLSELSRFVAKQNGLAIEEGEMECEYIDDIE